MTDIKRPNYFIGQFLTADDFQAEQGYHLEHRRRANRLRFGPGILDGGFQVAEAATNTIEVGAGTAIDREGRELILLDAQPIDLGQTPVGVRYVAIAYQELELPEDNRSEGDFEGNIRITERPRVQLLDAAPSGERLGLDLVVAKITVSIDGGGNRRAAIDNAPPERQPSRLRSLDTEESLGATIRAADLWFGHSGRSGGAKRALVDIGKSPVSGDPLADKNGLAINHRDSSEAGWDYVKVGGDLLCIGNLGIGTTAPSALLSLVIPGAQEIAGTAQSAVLRVSAGRLGETKTDVLSLASIGFRTAAAASGNNVSLGVRAYRDRNDNSWHSTRVGISLDVDNTPQAGPSLWLKGGDSVESTAARVMISGGALMPTAGSTDNDGILFPSNPGGGGGDKAWIRYYARPSRPNDTTERTALEIGVDNDSFGANQDDILLMPSGGVGIGTTAPGAKLDIQGDIAVTGNVDGRDISADGARLDSHIGNTSNPHATTVAQIGALPAVQTFHFGLSGASTDQDVRHHLANAEIGSFVIGVTDRGGEYPDFRIYYMDQSRTIRKLEWQGAVLQ